MSEKITDEQIQAISAEYARLRFDWPSNEKRRDIPPERILYCDGMVPIHAEWHVTLLLQAIRQRDAQLQLQSKEILRLQDDLAQRYATIAELREKLSTQDFNVAAYIKREQAHALQIRDLQLELAELRKPVSDIVEQLYVLLVKRGYSQHDAFVISNEILDIEELRKPVEVERNEAVESIRRAVSEAKGLKLSPYMQEMMTTINGRFDELFCAHDTLAQDCARFRNAHDVMVAEMRGLREQLNEKHNNWLRTFELYKQSQERERQLQNEIRQIAALAVVGGAIYERCVAALAQPTENSNGTV
ncbi:MAG TPA: hypothetical protein VEC57_20870 [Candidatus Limnocylindrales bacterium]|nr:hypothetical protein [Candidatus Limnocylindrales bacterium]